ncbi:MAG: hypothetical protein WED06_02315, partial [Candidatus Paceibacterota bacterium]
MSETQKQKNNLPSSIDRSTIGFLIKDGKRFFPAPFLADEFGYAPDHVARLARQGKVSSFYDTEGSRWYVDRESLIGYKKQAELNKIRGGLKSTNAVLSGQDEVVYSDDDIVLSEKSSK